jgi:hypothetical protein
VRYQWHPELHSQLGKERLWFWRMGFTPTYDRKKVKARLLQLFKELEINSFAFYEMIGIHDLMLRVWLPTSLPLTNFESALKTALAANGVVMIDYFAVDEMVAHWVWTDEKGNLRPVNNSILGQGLPEEDVAKINNGKLHAADRQNYEDLNVIAPSGHGKGIKFFIIVRTESLPTSMLDNPQMLRDDVARIVHEANSMKEKSVYASSGGLGNFLVMGKVKTAQFPKIFSELIEPINELGLSHDFRGRTYTHICTSGLIDFVDVLPPWQDVVRESNTGPIESYLAEEESRVLEVKGSAFVNVESWLEAGKASLDEKVLGEGVLRAVAGMLNSDGGTVVVGALENREPFVKASEGEGPLSDRPWFDDRYIIFGVEEDYRVSGNRKDWDAFLQKLNRKIRDRIEPRPSPWVTIEARELLGRRLAVISVREPDSGWFYLRERKGDAGKFYVRQENETIVLEGLLADEYKKGKGRL